MTSTHSTIKKIISALSFLFFVTSSDVNAHPDMQELIRKNREQLNYAGVLKQLQDNQATYQDNSFFYYALLADYESFLGLYKQALMHDDMSRHDNRSAKLKNAPTLEEYQLTNAKALILKASQNHQIIFINEAHHSPQHRAFTLSLLQDLYNQGFRYFAAETFDENDHDVNQRGYPLPLKTGYYTDEPIYGELIRAARTIGYEIIAYEDTSANCDPFNDPSPTHCINLREKGQARNLYDRVISPHPKAKLLVHAGYGHITKLEMDNFTPMAVYFERLTGIQPYSIDQVTMSEHSHPNDENPVYKEIADSGQLKDSSVILNSDGSFWSPFGKETPYDLIVFQPRTIYKDQRPTWLFDIEQRKPLIISSKICKNTFPCVIEAFKQNEGTESVPVDRFFITKKQPVTLALMSGSYIIRSKDEVGKILSMKQITIPNIRSILKDAT